MKYLDFFDRVLFTIPIYQSLLFALFFLLAHLKTKVFSKLVMSVFMLISAVFFTFSAFYQFSFYQVLMHSYYLFVPVLLMFIPLFYIYAKALTQPHYKFTKKEWRHFLPAIALLILNLGTYGFLSTEEKYLYVSGVHPDEYTGFIMNIVYWIYLLGVFIIVYAQLFYYIFRFSEVFRNHRENIKNTFSFKEEISLNWLVILAGAFLLFFIINDTLNFLVIRDSFAYRVFYNLMMILIGLLLGYYGFIQKGVYKPKNDVVPDTPANPEISNTPDEQREILSKEGNGNSNGEKYVNSGLNDTQKEKLKEQLHMIMVEGIHRDSKLSINDLASRLDTKSKYVSQVINEKLGKNFYNFVNEYRIKDAKDLLTDPEYQKYSVEGVAHIVGFNTKSSFNAAFKKHSGQTPSEYRKENLPQIK